MSEEAKKRAAEARERARGFGFHEAARRRGRSGTFNDRILAEGEGLAMEAELAVIRRLLCELHPALRESQDFALARFWELVADEVSKC